MHKVRGKLVLFLLWLGVAFVYHRLQAPSLVKQVLPICVGILAFEGVQTLENTLSSYGVLFELVKQRTILFQDLDSSKRKKWAHSVASKFPDLKLLYEEHNSGQRLGFLKLAQNCQQPYVVILEEDFRVADTVEVAVQLNLAIELLNSGVDAVRLRSRLFPGEPNHAHLTWLHNGGHLGSGIEQTHLIEHVVWDSLAELHIPQIHVCRNVPKTWCASSKHACYTNNPVLYRSAFLRKLIQIAPEDPDTHFENFLTQYWATQNYTVAYSDGIFTHERLDRTRVS